MTPVEDELAAFELLRTAHAEALAQNRFLQLGLAEHLAGSRVLDDRFATAEMTIVLPRGRIVSNVRKALPYFFWPIFADYPL